MRRVLIHFLFFIFFLLTPRLFSQCYNDAYVNGVPDSVEICLGDSVTLNMVGSCPTYLMNNDFNLGNAGVGWSATNQAMFTNPCAPHSPDGTTYMWMGSTSAAPRILTTVAFNVSTGGTISFEMRYAVQSAASPCEGPDEYAEGVALQYSVNGGSTWVTIAYFAPNGDILNYVPTASTPGASGQTPFTVWQTYTYPIPVAAQTTATLFRWAQLGSTSNVYDHWGLDNVTIGVPPPNTQYWWSHGATGQNPPPVAPTTTTTYTAYVSDGTDTASSSVAVIVHQPPAMSIGGLAQNHCVNGNTSTMTGTPTGGVFSGTGVTGNTFDPAVAGLGTHDITYTYNIIGNSIGQTVAFEDDFGTDKGWTGYGTGGWARAAAAASSGCSGSAGPAADHTQNGNNFIIGTYIGACYPNSLGANNFLTSPVINCTGFTSVQLDFWRWAGCESSSYDKIQVDVYNGTTWVNVWQNSATFSDAAWTQQTINVSTQANNNPNFRVRFGIGPTDGSVVYIGWNIDDLIITGTGPVSDTLCSFTTTATTEVLPAPVALFSMTDTVCINENATITFTGTASTTATYTWDFNGGTVVSGGGQGPYLVSWPADGTKTVSLTITENGCVSAIYEENIIVLPSNNPLCACWTPPVTILADTNTCINQAIIVSSQGGASSFNYNWDFASGNVASGSGGGPYSVSWSNAGNYTITLTVTDSACFPFDTSLTVSVQSLPQVSTTSVNEICGQGNGSATATGGTSYLWSNGANTATMSNVSAGTYTVTVTEGICSGTATASIGNVPGPTASFSVNSHSQSIMDGPFEFTDMSMGATTWEWNFGDNGVSTAQNPSYSYSGSGTFTVTLTVTDNNNCSDEAYTSLYVYDLYTIYFPSAFSPDGDGLNDFFGPFGLGIDNNQYEMHIFDRWGKEIFTTNDVNHYWDGKICDSNKEPIPGIYTYKVTYNETGGKRKSVMGTVLLLLMP